MGWMSCCLVVLTEQLLLRTVFLRDQEKGGGSGFSTAHGGLLTVASSDCLCQREIKRREVDLGSRQLMGGLSCCSQLLLRTLSLSARDQEKGGGAGLSIAHGWIILLFTVVSSDAL